ncbi:hypothetical protein [Candidatus Stoquefichus sp. SB1]|uniref:hypothetical protein n=1 Tax=Candidatus Stoquefichus sp. SB1 TaxID=1658109 RepID=UPI001E2FCD22|nr:hypothetical protein [Candidatus Stoquefichus sp. SB1]
MNEETCIEELLNGLNMGMIAIDHLMDKIEDVKLRDIVIHQRKHYGDLKEKVVDTYPHAEDEVKNKFMLESMIEMKTLLTDDAKIAKMLTEGSNQAIMTMTHLLNKEIQIDQTLKSYCDDFEDISKKYIEELKEFL